MENFILGQWSTFERIPFCFGVDILINKNIHVCFHVVSTWNPRGVFVGNVPERKPR